MDLATCSSSPLPLARKLGARGPILASWAVYLGFRGLGVTGKMEARLGFSRYSGLRVFRM